MKEFDKKYVRRGEIHYCDFGTKRENRGSEQFGKRPCVIIQNDIGNTYSPTTIVIPLTSREGKHSLPTHHNIGNLLDTFEFASMKDFSITLGEQIRVVDKSRLCGYVGKLSDTDMNKVDDTIRVSLALN